MTITMSSAHSPNFPLLHLRQSSISNPFRCFIYVTAHSPTLTLLNLRHSSFSNPSFVSPTSQALHLIHLASRIDIEIYSRAHSPTFLSLHLSHNSFSNPSVALPTSQLILQPFRDVTYVTTHSQPFRRFSYVTGSSLTSPGEPSMKEAERSLNASWIPCKQKTKKEEISYPTRDRLYFVLYSKKHYPYVEM